MKVLVLSNNTLEQKDIENNLETLQSIVGGYIEIPYLCKTFNENGIDVIMNEEGKYIEGLDPVITIVDSKTKEILDVVHGNCVFASHDKHGHTVGLNDKQIKIVMDELKMEVLLVYKDSKEYQTKLLFV